MPEIHGYILQQDISMNRINIFYQRGAIIAGGIGVVIMIGLSIAYEPVTRNYIATDWVCSYCHVEREYLHSIRMSFTKSHPAETEEGQSPARCVDCHLPEGFWNTTYAYTHAASITDLFGHFRDREGERAGDWIPLSAARAYRVRDRLLENDSVTCNICHIESEIKFSRPRGEKAHADAQETGETCIECHSNLVHRFVEVRLALADTSTDEEEFEDEFEDDFEDDFDDDLEDDFDDDLEEEEEVL